jgi:hypothetical protein
MRRDEARGPPSIVFFQSTTDQLLTACHPGAIRMCAFDECIYDFALIEITTDENTF